jgi:hypothetical protein
LLALLVGGTCGFQHIGRQFGKFVEEGCGMQDENAAVPELVAAGEVLLCGGAVGFLGETADGVYATPSKPASGAPCWM